MKPSSLNLQFTEDRSAPAIELSVRDAFDHGQDCQLHGIDSKSANPRGHQLGLLRVSFVSGKG